MKDLNPLQNIQLLSPCKANWNEMDIHDKDRFCKECNKVVYDFTDKTAIEFKAMRDLHGSICGRFRASQLVEKTSKKSLIRRFVSSFLLFLGYNIWSSNLQAQTLHFDNDSASYVKINDTTLKEEEIVDDIFLGAVAAEFPVYKDGGEEGMFKFFADNIKYSPDFPAGLVYISFTVDKNGAVRNAKVTKSLQPDADKEVLRVVNLLEFTPGTAMGRSVEVNYSVPFRFKRSRR